MDMVLVGVVCLVILILVAGFIEARRRDVEEGKERAMMVMKEIAKKHTEEFSTSSHHS